MKKLFVLALFPLVLSVSIVAQNGPTATTAAMTKPATTDKPKRGPVFRPTKDQIKEVFLQVAIYVGVPAAVDSFRIAREVFKELGDV